MKPMRWIMVLWILCSCTLPPWAAGAGEPKDSDRPGGVSIPEAEFREAFTRYLCTHLRKPSSDVVVSRFKVSEKAPVPAGPVTIQLYQKERSPLYGLVRLAALVSVQGAVRHETTLTGWVDVFESVVCTSRPLKKGQVLKAEDLYLSRQNVSRGQGRAVMDIDKAVGLVVRHSVRQNTPLREWMLEKAPVLDRGAVVTILAQLGGLRVTVKGVALERGYPGEMVKVQNSMSQKAVFARVVDSSHVRVEF